LDGWIQKAFPISAGEFYRFSAVRKTQGVEVPRHSVLARVLWQDDAGKMVSAAPTGAMDNKRPLPTAEPEHPLDGAADAAGWTQVQGIYRAPTRATRAIVELHLQHAPNGHVEWSNVALTKVDPPASRKARLATCALPAEWQIAACKLRRVRPTHRRRCEATG
jgi:hypothetical protein